MFHKRRLGVKEGNAIEDIVVYEMRKERGIATSADEIAYDEALKVVERRPLKREVASAPSPEAAPSFQHPSGNMTPPISYLFGPVRPSPTGDPLRVLAYIVLFFVGWVALASIYNMFS